MLVSSRSTMTLYILILLLCGSSAVATRTGVSHLRSSTSPSPAVLIQTRRTISTPSHTRVLAETQSPTVLPLNRSGGHPYCNICGKGFFISTCNGVIKLPGLPSQTTCCGLDQLSMAGFINPAYCPFFPLLNTSSICSCSPDYPTNAPTRGLGPGSTQQPSPYNPNGACNVRCPLGDPLYPNVTVTGWPYDVPCSNLSVVTVDSFYNPFICRAYQKQVHRTCGCPSLLGTASPSSVPSTSLQPSSVYKFPRCYICGNTTMEVTKPDFSIKFPGMQPINCSELEYRGINGLIEKQFCTAFSYYNLNSTCGCKPRLPSTSAPKPAFSIQAKPSGMVTTSAAKFAKLASNAVENSVLLVVLTQLFSSSLLI